ncbi:hypothetical protein ASJ79_24820 [Mycobacterium sp. NAZ190054]|nr:hypothetical protein ASJ79_24820 [Mycobacterium sp. NAZ190054]
MSLRFLSARQTGGHARGGLVGRDVEHQPGDSGPMLFGAAQQGGVGVGPLVVQVCLMYREAYGRNPSETLRT